MNKRPTICATPHEQWLGVFLILIAALLTPLDAMAADGDGVSFGLILCNMRLNSGAIGYIVIIIAYCMGVFFLVNGLLLLRTHFDNPSQPKVVPAIARLLIAGACLSAQPFAGILQRSIFGGGLTANGAESCTPGEVVPLSDGASGLDVVMNNFVSNIHNPIFMLLSILCFGIGLYMIVMGLNKASKIGTDPKAAAPHVIVVHWVIGALLISIGASLSMILQTLFGSANLDDIKNFSGINWSTLTENADTTKAADEAVRSVMLFVRILGGISFVRGWMLIKKAVEGGGNATIPQGVTHIIGGAMAINIVTMVGVFDKTFGTSFIK